VNEHNLISDDYYTVSCHALSTIPKNYSSRLVVIEAEVQVTRISISGTLPYCVVTDGTVNYYQKGDKKLTMSI